MDRAFNSSVGIDGFTFQSGYIPIQGDVFQFVNRCYFTFQSGYIPMGRANQRLAKQLSFTFQSGYIPIVIPPSYSHFLSVSLHSNLVIFQFTVIFLIYCIICSLHSNLVIFQSC